MRSNRNANTRMVACHLLLIVACSLGCGRNPYGNPGYWGAPYASQYPGVAPGAAAVPGAIPGYPPAQVTELERRVQQLDMDNRQLTTQLAQSQQKWQVSDERANLFQRQLQDATVQLQQARLAQQDLQGQARGLQASMAARGGATLRPNTSNPTAGVPGLGATASVSNAPPATQSPQIASLQVPGAVVQMEGAVVRIRVPADQLFAPGMSQLNPAAYQVIDSVATAIFRNFPKQRVAIEAHTDAASGGPQGAQYQLATAQAQAVMDQLVRRNTLPTQQLAIVAHGSNFPRGDNQSPAGRAENRRIEFVVYPETF